MGFFGDLLKEAGKEILKAGIEGAVEGFNQYQQDKNKKNRIPQIEYQNEDELEKYADSGNLDAIGELAAIYFNQMDYDNARYWCKKGCAYNDGWCMHLMGTIARDTGNYAEAERWYSRNTTINDYSLSASNLGYMYLNVNEDSNLVTDYNQAEYYFRKAYQSNMLNAEASFGLAMSLLAKGDFNPNEVKQLLKSTVRNGEGEFKQGAQDLLNEMK